jgi:hypothetical protein
LEQQRGGDEAFILFGRALLLGAEKFHSKQLNFIPKHFSVLQTSKCLPFILLKPLDATFHSFLSNR